MGMQLENAFRGCLKAHIDHKYGTFDDLQQGSCIILLKI